MNSLIPYATLAGEVTFKVVGAKLDGRDLPLEMIAQQDRVVALHHVERRKWEEARLELRVELPEAELSSGRWNDVACVAVLVEGVTNSRTVAVMRRLRGGTWTGNITLAHGAYRDRAELSVSVVATVDDVAGRIIGRSEDDWIVDLVARKPVRQQEADIRQIDFRSGGEEWLLPFKDAPWLMETSGEAPTIYLNTGFEGVVELLDSGGSPLENAVRGVVAAQIAADAWNSMFHSAVSNLEVDEDGTPQWPTGWRDRVLRSMLPDILPEVSFGDALWEIHSRRAENTGRNDLQPRIQYAASRRARVARNLGSTIHLLHRAGRENRS